MCIHTHIYICAYVYTHMHASVHACVYMCICVYTCIRIDTYTCVRARACVCVRMRAHVCVCVCVSGCTRGMVSWTCALVFLNGWWRLQCTSACAAQACALMMGMLASTCTLLSMCDCNSV